MADDPNLGLEENWAKIKARISPGSAEDANRAGGRRPGWRGAPAWAIAGAGAAAVFVLFLQKRPESGSTTTVKGLGDGHAVSDSCDLELRTEAGALVPKDSTYGAAPGARLLLAARCAKDLFFQV